MIKEQEFLYVILMEYFYLLSNPLGNTSPGQSRDIYIPTLAVACNHKHRRRLLYFLGDTSPRQVRTFMPTLVVARRRHNIPLLCCAMRRPAK